MRGTLGGTEHCIIAQNKNSANTAIPQKIGKYRNVIVKAYVVSGFVVLRAKNEAKRIGETAKTMMRL